MKYKVTGDRLLVKRQSVEQDEGGLLIPEKVKKRPHSGEILAIGKDVTEVAIGQTVFFSEYAGHFLDLNNDFTETDLLVMREHEVLAIELGDEDGDEDSDLS